MDSDAKEDFSRISGVNHICSSLLLISENFRLRGRRGDIINSLPCNLYLDDN